ncbi:MAG: hypothetical protein J0I32_14115 [Sphingobacteriales bacterium]|mgnify:CR=1 FL=1|nr:hypothetical protein [Sphingobacteriales bacterium]OJW02948.1 MAG: hypothetical protein BGO52_01175 [Sphingobacteriales bacterium 44-61]
MPQSAIILQELQELNSSLTPHAPVGYQVPESYFEGLATQILQRIRAMEAATPDEELAHLSPLLAGISRQSPYTVPADYFTSLDPSIAFYEDMSAQKELEQVSPLLGGLGKQHPFTVPEGYFEKPLLPVIEEQKEAPVVRMAPRKWFKYAIAASITAIVALGTVLLLNQQSTPGVNKQPYAWVEKNMKKVSTEDISKFVDLADDATPDIAKTSTQTDIKNLLKNVSDKEIQDFLKDVPADETDEDDIFLN